jgi:hypothetical protein
MFSARFHQHAHDDVLSAHADAFAWALCDPLGRCSSLSIAQVDQYLRCHDDDLEKCARDAADVLLSVSPISSVSSSSSSSATHGRVDVKGAARDDASAWSELTEWLTPHDMSHYGEIIASEGFKVSLAHTHAHTHTHTRARARAHTHVHIPSNTLTRAHVHKLGHTAAHTHSQMARTHPTSTTQIHKHEQAHSDRERFMTSCVAQVATVRNRAPHRTANAHSYTPSA